jgi:hypothetical protein
MDGDDAALVALIDNELDEDAENSLLAPGGGRGAA